MTTRVLVVDDQALLRASFRLLIDTAPGMIAVGEADDGAAAVEMARDIRPDVVLMDIRMPHMDGIEATRRIVQESIVRESEGADIRVLILTTFDLDDYVYAALRAGASGFVLKDTRPADLIGAIQVVSAGDALLAPTVTRRLIAEFAKRPAVPVGALEGLAGLTVRERDVLRLVGRGLSNAEISATLQIGVTTVKTHISNLLAKLEARDRAQLVIAAYETGLVKAGA